MRPHSSIRRQSLRSAFFWGLGAVVALLLTGLQARATTGTSVSPIFAQGAVPVTEMSGVSPPTATRSLFDRIQQGGWAMWPLGGCSLALCFLGVYGLMLTQRLRFFSATEREQTLRLVRNGHLDEARAALQGGASVFSRALAPALAKARLDRPDGHRPKVEEAIGEVLDAEENAIAQWVNTLNVVATVAPMLGLLGTVSGMISAFDVLSEGGMGRPELLAGNIGEALITTATGLVIGIPAMVAYFTLRNRLTARMIATTHAATTITEALELAAEDHTATNGASTRA